MNAKVILGFLIFFILVSNSYAQAIDESVLEKKNKVIVFNDERVDQLLDVYKSSFVLQGYRIQIFSDNKKQPARDEKAKFLTLYNNVKAHEIYQQPFFKIRVGDFRTKLEAYKFQREIYENFPNSFIVKDEIEVEQLLNK
jgi:hypothetical protein